MHSKYSYSETSKSRSDSGFGSISICSRPKIVRHNQSKTCKNPLSVYHRKTSVLWSKLFASKYTNMYFYDLSNCPKTTKV